MSCLSQGSFSAFDFGSVSESQIYNLICSDIVTPFSGRFEQMSNRYFDRPTYVSPNGQTIQYQQEAWIMVDGDLEFWSRDGHDYKPSDLIKWDLIGGQSWDNVRIFCTSNLFAMLESFVQVNLIAFMFDKI